MKHLRENFTEEEFELLKEAKAKLGFNWHDFILAYAGLINSQKIEQMWKEQKAKDAGEERKRVKR